MRWNVIFTCLAILVSAGAVPAGGVDVPKVSPDPQWPLDLDTRYLTSNFMEYRSGRFHAGLDLKTQSRSGFAARAVEDGTIVRVRSSPHAYGRAIYLLSDSGRTYVYAHLSRFNDSIRSRVRQVQEQSGKYRVNLFLTPGEMRVRQGEVLGLTGESGTGGPHLHFEVRDPDNRPVNPLAMGFAVPDTFAPVIHAIRAVPADLESRIDGHSAARLVKSSGGKGLRGTQPLLQIAGPVAFATKIIDAGDVAGHKLEPWLIEVRLDGELVYRCQNDRFDFSENSLQRLEWLEVPGIKDHWLYRRPGNTLTGRLGTEWFRGDTGMGLSPGSHELEITAADFAGNTTSVVIPLLAAQVQHPQPPSVGGWLEDPVVVVVDSLSNKELRPFVNVEDEVFRVLDPEQGDPVLASTSLAIIPQELDTVQLERARRQGLELMGPAARYLAADWPIDAAVAVELTGPVTTVTDSLPVVKDPAMMVYRWGRDRWSPGGRLMVPGQDGVALRFALSNPGLFAVFRDDAPPVIFPADSVITVAIDPRGEAHGVTLPRWEIFPVSLTDLGSGIATSTIETTLDGEPLVVEPDLPRRRILVELPDDLPAGGHVLVVKAADEAGNEAMAEVLVQCSE